jgi:hypothetical protein
MNVGVWWALLSASFAGGLAGCVYDYSALMGAGGGGSNVIPGTAGGGGSAGTSGGSGGAGPGTGGAGTGGITGGTGGGAGGEGGRGGAVGTGGVSGGTGGRRGDGGSTGSGGSQPDSDLVLWYQVDDGAGTVALDSSTVAGAPRNGTLATAGTGGAAGFSTTRRQGTHAVSLTANGTMGGGYVIVHSLHDLAPGALTISAWVQVTTAQRWQRVFDLGNTTTSNLALTVQNGTDFVRFIIRTGGTEQEIASSIKLSLSTWYHLAVVLREGSPYTGDLYVDGALAGTNTAMTLHPADLGATMNNFLGRSQFAADPYFAGLIDDFRVYRRALSPEQIGALSSR